MTTINGQAIVTYGSLRALLRELGFAEAKVPVGSPEGPLAYRLTHRESGVQILLPPRHESTGATQADLGSARRHLVRGSLISEEDWLSRMAMHQERPTATVSSS